MINSKKIRWKLDQYSLYREYGFGGTSLSFYIRELVSSKSRSVNYNNFQEYYKKEFIEGLYGIKFDNRTPFGTLKEVFEEGIYQEFNDFIPDKGSTVLDVGAQCGDYSLMCSMIFGSKKIVAIEPLKTNYEVLLRNLDLNAVKNVVPINAAASYMNGETEVCYSGDMAFKGTVGNIVSVKMIRIDDLELQDLNLMKIDVEGYELDVLNGALETIQNFKPRVILETHSKHLKEQCMGLLEREGYHLKHEGRVVTQKNSNMDSIQNLFFLPV